MHTCLRLWIQIIVYELVLEILSMHTVCILATSRSCYELVVCILEYAYSSRRDLVLAFPHTSKYSTRSMSNIVLL